MSLRPESQSAALRGAALLSLLLTIAGCSVFKNSEEAQAVVTQRLVGMHAIDFFDRYGRATQREPQLDGSVEYAWVSPITDKAPHGGWYGIDDRTCTLKVVAGRNGRISAATIVLDNPGRTTTSRCLELFREA